MKNTLQESINRYGASDQLNMVIEECAELIQAVNKVKRNKLVADNFIMSPTSDKQRKVLFDLTSEVADVEIMLEQIKLMLPTTFTEAINISKERKIERLKERLNN